MEGSQNIECAVAFTEVRRAINSRNKAVAWEVMLLANLSSTN